MLEQIFHHHFNKVGTYLLGPDFEDLRVTFPTSEFPEFVETLDQLFSGSMTLKRSRSYIGYYIFVDLEEFLHSLDKSVDAMNVLGLYSYTLVGGEVCSLEQTNTRGI